MTSCSRPSKARPRPPCRWPRPTWILPASAWLGSQTQLDQALQVGPLTEPARRTSAWEANQADKIDLPVWYFEKDEMITALQSELSDAQANLDTELSNLNRELKQCQQQRFHPSRAAPGQSPAGLRSLPSRCLTRPKPQKTRRPEQLSPKAAGFSPIRIGRSPKILRPDAYRRQRKPRA